MTAAYYNALLPINPSFAGHQTFAMRSGWIKKGVDALTDPAIEGNLFNRDDALVTLGVGKNMVQSIRHWLLATRMAEDRLLTGKTRELYLTALGSRLFGTKDQEGWDSYLEDDATLWLLHWNLAGPGSLAFSWAYTFNRFRDYEFSREMLTEAILTTANGVVSKPLSQETIGRDVDCLLHTYVPSARSSASEDDLDCPLQSLGLIRASYDKQFRFKMGAKPTLPTSVFLYAVLTFWEWKQSDSPSFSVWDVTYAEGSPGLVFKLDEESVLEYLDGLSQATQGIYSFEDNGAIREIVKTPNTPVFTPISLLESHYA